MLNTLLARRSARRFACIAIVAAAACGDAPTDPGANQQTVAVAAKGTWALQSIDGMPLPYDNGTLDGIKSEIVSGFFKFADNDAAVEGMTIRMSDASGSMDNAFELPGTYVVAGSKIIFTEKEGETREAAVTGNTFTVKFGQRVHLYKKQ
jgi:hypothetical protein